MDFISKIIEASAGTGKTHILTEEFILKFEQSPSIDSLKHFLALTFSEKAACEMKERIISRIWNKTKPDINDEYEIIRLENNLFRIRISTIHSFCRGILKRFGFLFGIDPLFIVADENTSSILFERAKYKFLRNISGDDRDFIFLCQRLKLNDLLKFINDLHRLHPHIFLGKPVDSQITSMIYKYLLSIETIYEGIKKEKSFIDFNDLEIKTYSIIKENPESLNILYDFDESIDIIFIDEFQDTNFLQWEIIKEFILDWISGYGSKLETGRPYGIFIVGDKKQSIYYFRGADNELMSQAEVFLSRNLKKQFLTESFRSFPGIIKFVNEIFRNLIPQEELLKPGSFFNNETFQDKGFIEIKIFEKEDRKINIRKKDEYEWIAKKIKKILKDKYSVWDKKSASFRPIEYRDIAILFRKRTHLTILEEVLNRFEIPYVNIGGIGFYQEPEILFMLSIVFALIDPSDALSFWHLENSAFKINREFILKYTNQLSQKSIVDIVEDILKEIEFKESLNVQKKANIEKFLIILNDLQKFPLFQIATSLRHLMKNSNEPKGDIFTENENAVKILTVHSSKGLEFPIVFLIDIEQGKLDKKNSSVMYNKSKEGMDSQQKYIFGLKTESEEELSEEFYKRIKQDEINLLYVALTRAKQGIICIGYNDVDKNTIWIKILEPFFPQYKAIEVSEDEDINLFSFSYVEEEKQIKKFLPQIHSFIPVSWTSISSVNKTISDFTEKYDEEILGMVIHKILAEIGNNKIPIEFESLKKRAKNYFEKFGSIFDEELLDIHINNIISKNIKEIISSVQNSFNELNFLFFMDNQLFQGYIDRLIIKDDIVYIYDFKTHKNLKIRQDDKKQLFIYKKAAESLFPGKSYKTFLIFTFYGIIKLINTGGKNERRNSSGL